MLNVKEKFKKAANTVFMVGGVAALVATTGCDDKQAESEKKPVSVVETVKEKRQTTEQERNEFCEGIANKDRIVDYDPKTNTCHVIERGDMIMSRDVLDTSSNNSMNWRSYYAGMLGCSRYIAAAYMASGGDDSYYHKDNNARFPCYDSYSDKREFLVNVAVSFTNNLLSEDEFLVKVCKTNKNCKCKKAKNGKDVCEIKYKKPFFVRGNIDNYHEMFSFEDILVEAEGERLDYVAVGKENYPESYYNHLPLKRCPNDARKFCVKYSDVITVKFDDIRFSDEEYKKCENKCSKLHSTPSVSAETFASEYGLEGDNCECEITDEMYDNCKIKCADQGSKPVQQRRDFDGNCECKESKESAALKQAQDKKIAMVQSMVAIRGM